MKRKTKAAYCLHCSDNGIGAKVFVIDITEADIDSQELGFSFGGRRVLKRILKVYSYNYYIRTSCFHLFVIPIEFVNMY